MDLPPSLWPALHRIATGRPWPPRTASDANAFVVEAKLQFLLPLLCETRGLPSLVTETLDSYRAIERLTEARASILENDLQRVLAVLAGEDVVLLKGSDYGHRVYDRPALRPMADTDLLVPSSRIEDVSARLEAAGFHRSFHGSPAWRLKSAHEYVFTTEQTMIEVHQSFIQRARATIDYEALWKRRVPMAGFPANVFRLHDVDAVAYHALSMGIDEFQERLIRDVDLWLLLRRLPVPLQAVADRVSEWSCRHALFGALTIAATLFPDLHSDEYDRVRASLIPARRQRFLENRILPDVFRRRYDSPPGRIRQLWRKFWLMDSMRLRTAFAFHHAYASAAGQLLPMARRTERNISNAPSSTGQP